MHKRSLISLSIFCLLAFASFTSAQTTTGGRVAIIDTEAFADETAGITKYTDALKKLNAEFSPIKKELETIAARLKTIEREIDGLRASGSAADQKLGQQKVDESERLRRDQNIKAEDARVRFELRRSAMTAPLNESIGKALKSYAKQKGYAVVLDISRDTAGVIITVADEKADITKEFIAFYNGLQ